MKGQSPPLPPRTSRLCPVHRFLPPIPKLETCTGWGYRRLFINILLTGRAWLVILSDQKIMTSLILLRNFSPIWRFIFFHEYSLHLFYVIFALENNVLNVFTEICLVCKEKNINRYVFSWNMAFSLFLWKHVKPLLWFFPFSFQLTSKISFIFYFTNKYLI